MACCIGVRTFDPSGYHAEEWSERIDHKTWWHHGALFSEAYRLIRIQTHAASPNLKYQKRNIHFYSFLRNRVTDDGRTDGRTEDDPTDGQRTDGNNGTDNGQTEDDDGDDRTDTTGRTDDDTYMNIYIYMYTYVYIYSPEVSNTTLGLRF